MNYVTQNLNNPEELLEMHIILTNVNLNTIKTLTTEDQVNTINDLIENVFEPSNTFQTNQAINEMLANPEVFESITPLLIEKNIDNNELDPCSKQIMNSLKNLQQKDIAAIFSKLNNPNMIVKPWYNTKIVIENPINSLDGTMLSNSSPPKKPTKLSIARTLLHELIHAYFDSLFDDCNPSIPGSCNEIESFEDLWQHYIITQNGGTNPNDAQHLAIAKSFTNILARALQEYQTGIPVPDNVEPEQDYKDLAWFGLEGNPQNSNSASLIQVFNSEYPIGSDKREKYNIINDAENSQATGNVNGLLITPKSIPCE